MRTTFIKIVLIATFYTPCLFAQTANPKQWDMVKEMFYQIKTMKQYGYKYTLSAKFPDGSVEQVKGDVFMNTDNKTMLTDCKSVTTLLTDKWYLTADHNKKTISIININKSSKKRFKEQADQFVFGNTDYTNEYVDSAILGKGTINMFHRSGDTVKCSIIFSPESQIKNIDLVYDYNHKVPLSYTVKLFYPFEIKDKRFKGKGTTKMLTCNNYTRDIDKSRYEVQSYFMVVNGKAILKKYKEYTLKTDL